MNGCCRNSHCYLGCTWFTCCCDQASRPQATRENLTTIEAALADNIERSTEIQRRVASLRTAIDEGADVTTLIENEDQPRMVEMLSANLAILEDAGSNFRQSLAQALRSEA